MRKINQFSKYHSYKNRKENIDSTDELIRENQYIKSKIKQIENENNELRESYKCLKEINNELSESYKNQLTKINDQFKAERMKQDKKYSVLLKQYENLIVNH